MYEETLDLLRSKKGQFRVIAQATGLNYDWLHQVSRGVIKNPSIRKIETLHKYLSGTEETTRPEQAANC